MTRRTTEIVNFIIEFLDKNKFFERHFSNEYFGVIIPFIDKRREVFKKEIRVFIQMALLEWNHEQIEKLVK